MPIAPIDTSILPDPSPLIGAERRYQTAGGRHRHVYPANAVATVDVPLAGGRDIDAAVSAARAASVQWAAFSVAQRRSLLLDLATAVRAQAAGLSVLQTAENGTPQQLSGYAIETVADSLEYFAGWTDKIGGEVHPMWPQPALDYSVRQPYGVVAVIIPWNSPFYTMGSVIAPALAAGNCVVVKPPEVTPFTAIRFAELCLDVGIPPGVVNVVPGGGEAGAALVAHTGIDKVHFTGSAATASRILGATARTLTPVALELGGKSPNLIFDDADSAVSIQMAVLAVLNMAGQGCINGTRVLVQSGIYDEVVAGCEQALKSATVGDPMDVDTVVGPVIDESACERILATIDRAVAAEAGELVTGGRRCGGDLAAGYFIEPTLFADVKSDSEIAREEIFGPVLSIMRFDTEEQAIAIANDTPYGLAAYVQTNDVARAHRVAAGIDAGMVWINGFGGLTPSLPFGGMKRSGAGRLGGRAGLDEFTHIKNVWLAL